MSGNDHEYCQIDLRTCKSNKCLQRVRYPLGEYEVRHIDKTLDDSISWLSV